MPARCWSRRSVSHWRPIVADPAEPRREPGWPQVLLVAFAVVVVVLGAAFVTGLMPMPIQQAIFHGPVLIAVLIIGTVWLLWRIAHGRSLDGER
jgi:heme A synthase